MAQKYLRVIAKVVALPDKVEDLKDVFSELVQETRQEKGCFLYECLQNQNDPTDFTFVEIWENQECLDSHMATPHFQAAIKKLDGLVAANPDIGLYEQVF